MARVEWRHCQYCGKAYRSGNRYFCSNKCNTANTLKKDPTPEEIAERKAIEQLQWSPAEEQRRAGSGRNPRVEWMLSEAGDLPGMDEVKDKVSVFDCY